MFRLVAGGLDGEKNGLPDRTAILKTDFDVSFYEE